MEDAHQQIEKLIAADKVEAALSEFRDALAGSDAEIVQELIQHQAALAKVTKERRRGLIDVSREEQTRNRVRYALLDLLGEWFAGEQSEPLPPAGLAVHRTSASVPTVFISYSHADLGVVGRISAALESEGIRVCIDSKNIRPGEDVEAFILRVVAESDVVLSIVSGNSLLSPWVGMESVLSLYGEALNGGHKLIAGYLDETFLDIGFRVTATEQIDAKIGEIDALFPVYIEKHLDTSDLNRQKSRLFELRNNLGKVLERLRNSLVLDLREPMWAESLPRLLSAIKAREQGEESV